ncbi:hypothetical protein BJ322DRAFT_881742 [Thelephora terrestris]|uniref:BTB domain-containing protein n=1 Tax=Thelephora terrestris TaxID=56493 RepID=A0A9P6HE49_9AGAM|nr:hypothetical protein BJ322DRAFT_881742 [Thelephora terrestris]
MTSSSKPITASLKQQTRALKELELEMEALLPLKPFLTAASVPLDKVARSKDLWFKDGDIIIWAKDEYYSSLFRVHRRILKDSRAEPFCTVVDCDYPDPETSGELFLDGVWVLRYHSRDPVETMHVIKWMYEQPTISKRSVIPFVALKAYLERSDEGFVPAMRRCALEYLWNMLPTSLNYHQRIPSLVEDCYSENSTLVYKPHVLISLIELSEQHKLIAILPLLYYYIAQWPLDWITDGVPATSMEFEYRSCEGYRFSLPQKEVVTILAGREKLIRMRETHVFNFIQDFTSSGTALDVPIDGCNGEKRKETGETCFQWLMRVWYYMNSYGFITRPTALDIMNMGQWAELKKYCCEVCAKKVMEHMLTGRDEVWNTLPRLFGFYNWDDVVKKQKKVEEEFEAVIC